MSAGPWCISWCDTFTSLIQQRAAICRISFLLTVSLSLCLMLIIYWHSSCQWWIQSSWQRAVAAVLTSASALQKYCQLLLSVLCITTIKPIITNQEDGRFIYICKFSYSYYLYGNADCVNKILWTQVSKGHPELPGFVLVPTGEHMHQRRTGPERQRYLRWEQVLWTPLLWTAYRPTVQDQYQKETKRCLKIWRWTTGQQQSRVQRNVLHYFLKRLNRMKSSSVAGRLKEKAKHTRICGVVYRFRQRKNPVLFSKHRISF